MKTLFLSMLLSTSAFASTYSCEIKGFEDYQVEINLQSNKAAFFDNNDWSVVKFKNMTSSTVMLFSGKDYLGDALKISYDTAEGASLSGKYGRITFLESNKIKNASLANCRYVKAEELNSGI